MADSDTAKAKKERSPAYPFISLKSAVERLIALEAKFGRHPVPALKAGLAWGVKPESSQAGQILAALKSFGFVEYAGSNANRVASLTDDARNYLRAQQDSIKLQILKSAALRPRAISTYWAKWGRDRPIDEICLDELVLKGGFTASAARTFLRVYDETMAFAKVGDGDTLELVNGDGPDDDEPDSPDSENSAVGSQILSGQRPSVAPRVATFEKGVGMRQEVFALAEGDVTIQWPERMSKESLEDFSDWLKILERKVKRAVISPQQDPKN